jgi:Zn-dependent alcohol dehydrogenase
MAPTQTEAWVVEELGGPFKLMKLELDEPLDDEVLIQ